MSGAPEAGKPGRRIDFGALLPGIVFIAIVAGAGLIYWYHGSSARAEHRALTLQVKQLGLPDGYPLAEVPVYKGLTVKKSERTIAQSKEGDPMDKWVVNGETPDDKKKVFDFYNDELLKAGMSQQFFVSMPTGFGVHYADEKRLVEIEIEKLKGDKLTQVRMNVYKVKY